jgi:RNA polymerase sigma-70 factor (ECF subfamily)
VGCYLWSEEARAHVAWSIDVLTLRGERIAEITSFLGRDHFPTFGLPDVLGQRKS